MYTWDKYATCNRWDKPSTLYHTTHRMYKSNISASVYLFLRKKYKSLIYWPILFQPLWGKSTVSPENTLPLLPSLFSCYFEATAVILKNSVIVGHVPQKISIVGWYFLQKNGGEMACIIRSSKRWSDVVTGSSVHLNFQKKTKTAQQAHSCVC